MKPNSGRRRAFGLSLRLAWRNIWRQKRRTWLTALAMIFSNILLVFMISLQFGSYDMMINNTLRMFSGQIQVQRDGYHENQKMRQVIPAISELASGIRERFPQASVAARANAFVLVSSQERSFGTRIVGVEPGHEPGVSTIPGLVREGRYLDNPDAAEIVIGSVMARNLKVAVGDELTFLGSGREGSFAAGVVTVAGIFDSGSMDLDRSLAEVPLGYFQEAFDMRGSGHVIALLLDDLNAVDGLLTPLKALVGEREELIVLDWETLTPGLKQAIQADMTSAWFMYGVLIVLVAFSVLNTQLMSVLERTREFGVIMALGIRPRRLALLVLLETFLMALLGLLIGALLGGLVTGYFASAGFAYPGMDQMAEKFNMPAVIFPALDPLSVMLGPSVVFIFCLFAAIYPALKLYGLRPVDAMRAV
ncbi:MAG: ABC transporter permease [Xanthomonadales bacterium]|nr:ABC transporter permease [Gammaproteobacteria bacterium]NNK03244.1 ABC transporter permease [Xanthomonadales bacterium]